jgi:LPS-assembly lipoprotein
MKKVFIVINLLFLLSGCGFKPLYAKKKHTDINYSGEKTVKYTSAAEKKLASTFVEPIENRLGQMIRNNIRDIINPKGSPQDASYYLKISIGDIKESEQGIQIDNIATRKTEFFEASYFLKDKNKNTILSGTAKTEGSYNLLSSPYASLIAEEDAQKDAAKELAKDISLRLRVYFNTLETKNKKNGNLF